MIRISLIFLLGIYLFGCDSKSTEVSMPYYTQADFTPKWIEGNVDTIHQVADFTLTNQDGQIITNADLRGKIYVTNFFFTICPTVCPKMTNNLQRVQEAFAQDDEVMLVSHTVMPWLDSVEVLKDYALKNEIQTSKWQLLTGDKNLIYQLGRQSYFADEGFGKSVTDIDDFLHTENIVLVDGNQHIRGVYNGTLPLEMTRLIEDIQRLKLEIAES
ncbi:MAG: SCO family protein [Flammeovirgaceae bacterium]|nr:SCO family protein [Flammeovirgaceae bacterium]MBE62411.1 SCO family protein [Flammeovirgaceae bacterium]HCX20670.1 SCO family protein [Cytophagales bacterium]